MNTTRAASRIVVTLVMGLAAQPVSADCFQVAAGSTLYTDVLGQTVAGKVTGTTVGWFGRRIGADPTLRLVFVSTDGDQAVTQLTAHVRIEDAKPIACPAHEWKPAAEDSPILTWPGGGSAGTTIETAATQARRQRTVAAGRSCFPVNVPDIAATGCVFTRPQAGSCVAVATGKPVYAHADTSTRFGATTKPVVTWTRYAIGDFLHTDIGVVRRRDTRPARCPPPSTTLGCFTTTPRYRPCCRTDATQGCGSIETREEVCLVPSPRTPRRRSWSPVEDSSVSSTCLQMACA